MILLNFEKIDIKRFPNGEVLIDSEQLKRYRDKSCIVSLKFESNDDITNLIFIKKHLDEINAKVQLELPYLPYSRMDRTNDIRVFTLKYLCQIINDLNFDKVSILEPHSDVSMALLNKVDVKELYSSIDLLTDLLIKESTIIPKQDEVFIVFPDAGAEKRYAEKINKITKHSDYKKINLITANKERDFSTGRIKKLTLNGDNNINGLDAIIVDDLCSKGGTFMLTAEKLKEIGARNIYLVVTHCEDTIFEGSILNTDLISKVYTTNTILSKKHEKIHTIDLFGGNLNE